MMLVLDCCWELEPSSVLSASSIPPSKSLSSSPVLSLSMQLNTKLSENRHITMMISKGHDDLKTLLTHEKHWKKVIDEKTLFSKKRLKKLLFLRSFHLTFNHLTAPLAAWEWLPLLLFFIESANDMLCANKTHLAIADTHPKKHFKVNHFSAFSSLRLIVIIGMGVDCH